MMFYGNPMAVADERDSVDFGRMPEFAKNHSRAASPVVVRRGMAAGQMKTGPITHSMKGGAFGLPSVPTRLRNANAGERMIAKKLDVTRRMAGVVRRKAAASAAVQVNQTPRTGYPAISKMGKPAKMSAFSKY